MLAGVAVAWNAGRVVDKVLYWRFGAEVRPAPHPAPRDAAEAQRQDVDQLAALTRIDRSFSPEAAEQFRQRMAALRERAGTLDRAGFLLAVSEAVALARNAHTNVDQRAWRVQLASVPVRFEWFSEGLFVVRATADGVPLLGARVLEVDGTAPEAYVETMARFVGGTHEYARTSSLVLLESPEALHALDANAPADRLRLRVADAAGVERDVEIPALPPPQPPALPKPGRLYSPIPLDGEEGWRTLLDPAAALPYSLREPAKVVHAERLDGQTLYMHLWQVRDVEGQPQLARTMREALGRDRDPRWRRIVLDLRFDAGGDYPAVFNGIARIGRRLAPDGKLLVLTDNTTFSAAIIAAALAKHFAGPRATLVGERPGDALAFWAEGSSFILPNSKLRILTSTGYHDWAHGCRELRCYWLNFWYDVGVGSVEPQVPAAWRFEDYRRGVDTVLARALEL